MPAGVQPHTIARTHTHTHTVTHTHTHTQTHTHTNTHIRTHACKTNACRCATTRCCPSPLMPLTGHTCWSSAASWPCWTACSSNCTAQDTGCCCSGACVRVCVYVCVCTRVSCVLHVCLYAHQTAQHRTQGAAVPVCVSRVFCMCMATHFCEWGTECLQNKGL